MMVQELDCLYKMLIIAAHLNNEIQPYRRMFGDDCIGKLWEPSNDM